MKKSELLKKLYEDIDQYSKANWDINLVDFIVNKCEDYGMNPPHYAVETTFDDLTLFKTYKGWEPEN